MKQKPPRCHSDRVKPEGIAPVKEQVMRLNFMLPLKKKKSPRLIPLPLQGYDCLIGLTHQRCSYTTDCSSPGSLMCP